MAYNHGVLIDENPTSIVPPITADSAVQFTVGTAPVNLLDDPAGAVNVPILVNSFAEAEKNVGYSDSFDKFSICESIDASFRVYNVAPLVIVNVLDPSKHIIAVPGESHNLTNGQLTIQEEGIMLDSNFIVKNADGTTTYTKSDDYTVEFDDGYVLLKVVSGGLIDTDGDTSLQLDYNQLDPTAVTEDDIIGGYDIATGKYTGLENISQVFPRLGLIPGLIVCPGWSQKVNVGIAMTAKTEGINGAFKCEAIKDIDCSATGATTYSDVKAWKDENSYNDKHDNVLWPMVKIGTKKYHYSSVYAALVAYTDADSGQDVPYVSPSNKQLKISGTILEDGTEVYLDQKQGNYLNGQGIITAININGWRSWGNNTGIYPTSSDPKDRFIPVRRMFDWWGNTFILTYFQEVDDPMNMRLIETIVDSENIRANGFKAREQIAGAKIEFLAKQNPQTDLLNGTIRFNQYLTPYPPAETIIDTLEFDPNALSTALGIGGA